MRKLHLSVVRSAPSLRLNRAVRPALEGLEDRLLLYAALGDHWTFSSRITYSFMPDGTSVGGVPSALFQTLNANYPTATWENQIEQAASLWEGAANANLALVSDGGEAVGSAGDQQDDPRFGDIRIGAVPLPAGVLAETFLPPPANGGTDAGDILLNSTINWQINSNYDLQTVVAHEFGHALGLGESSVSTAVMYGTYNGIKQALTSDDIAGIQSIYGAPQFDQFNSGSTHNSNALTAANITSYITSNAQIAIPSLDITTAGQAEWFKVTVPSTTTGTMAVTVQSSNLSSLAPSLQVYNSSLSSIGQASAPNTFGATITVSSSVASGQVYYFKVTAAGGPGPIGAYGLLVNFGNQSQSPIQPPNTLVPSQPDQSGGTLNNVVLTGEGVALTTIGTLTDWASFMLVATTPGPGNGANGSSPTGVFIGGPTAQPMQSGTSVSVVSASSASNASAQISALPVAIGPMPTVLQAVDDALDQLASSD
jgi:hypothetical protein